MVLEVNAEQGDCGQVASGQVLRGDWRHVAMNSKREDVFQPHSAALGRCAVDGTGCGGQQSDWEGTGTRGHMAEAHGREEGEDVGWRWRIKTSQWTGDPGWLTGC